MQTSDSRFVVTREDLNAGAAAFVSDGLKIGRLPSCELVLNHPSVSRLHAGINEADGRFYCCASCAVAEGAVGLHDRV